jgi:hypothetical protein
MFGLHVPQHVSGPRGGYGVESDAAGVKTRRFDDVEVLGVDEGDRKDRCLEVDGDGEGDDETLDFRREARELRE